MKKNNKVIIVIAIFAIIFSLTKAYANSIGIDLLSLSKNKANTIANNESESSVKEIQDESIQTENDTLDYVDKYINGIDSELKQHTESKKTQSLSKIRSNYTDIKSELDSIRQNVVDNAKQQIDKAIDTKLSEEQSRLQNSLQSKISQKFN